MRLHPLCVNVVELERLLNSIRCHMSMIALPAQWTDIAAESVKAAQERYDKARHASFPALFICSDCCKVPSSRFFIFFIFSFSRIDVELFCGDGDVSSISYLSDISPPSSRRGCQTIWIRMSTLTWSAVSLLCITHLKQRRGPYGCSKMQATGSSLADTSSAPCPTPTGSCQFSLSLSHTHTQPCMPHSLLSSLTAHQHTHTLCLCVLTWASLFHRKKIRASETNSFGVPGIYEVKFPQTKKKKYFPTFGAQYTFSLVDAVDNVPEYLVHSGTLERYH